MCSVRAFSSGLKARATKEARGAASGSASVEVLGQPALRDIAPDVEALLAWAPRGATELECFVVPVDACYELAGLCRTHWRGFNGGDEVHREMDAFFARLRARAK